MCESNVYRLKDDKKELVMENVALITVDGEDITLSSILGERKKVKGVITSIDSEKHEVLIR